MCGIGPFIPICPLGGIHPGGNFRHFRFSDFFRRRHNARDSGSRGRFPLFGRSFLPIHPLDNLLRTAHHLRFQGPDQEIGPFAVRIANTAGYRHQRPVITVRHIGRDERTAPSGRFHDQRSFTQPGDQAVPLYESGSQRPISAGKLAEHRSTLSDHTPGRIGMLRRIDPRNGMPQDAHGRHPVFQSGPMSRHIHAVSQPTDNHQIGYNAGQFSDQRFADPTAVRSDLPGSHHRQPMPDIEIQISAHIQHMRIVTALEQTSRISGRVRGQHLQTPTSDKFQFLLCLEMGLTIQNTSYDRCFQSDLPAQFLFRCGIDSLRRTEMFQQMDNGSATHFRMHGQRNIIDQHSHRDFSQTGRIRPYHQSLFIKVRNSAKNSTCDP